MPQIFLSYASQDRPRAKAFAEALLDRGWSVFWDRTIPPGRVFDQVIGEALAQAECVVVLWSKASVASNWVKDEISDASERGTLIPALIDDVALPLGFRRLQAARIIGWPDKHDANEFEQLVQSVDRLVMKGASPAAPSPPPQHREVAVNVAVAGPSATHITATHVIAPPPPPLPRTAGAAGKAVGILLLFVGLGFAAGMIASTAANDSDPAGFAAAIPVWVLGIVLSVRMWLRR
jgi:hypothetical protein